jgi:Zn-dependent protease with chaperone function
LFNHLFFLILVLILLSLAPEVEQSYLELDPYMGFLCGLSIFFLTLFFQAGCGLLARKMRFKDSRLPLFLANTSLLLFLIAYHFVLASHLIYQTLPIVSNSQGFFVIISVFYYFSGMMVYYYLSYPPVTIEYGISLRSRSEMAISKLRFLLPFVLPFIFFSFFFDLLNYLPFFSSIDAAADGPDDILSAVIMMFITLSLLIGTLVFFPFFLQYIWGCAPMEDSELKDRLDRLCQKAGFKHAGLMIWTILNSSLTAAIVGVYHRFRYVMFTKRLILELPPDQIEAVLAHEMGHSFHKHMVFYPWVILGMLVVQGLFSTFFGVGIKHIISLLQLGDPTGFWDMAYPLLVFAIYSVILLSYFRIVYGFFSRNFERQADLYVFSVGLSGKSMIDALDSVAKLSGYIHEKPSWHHYSIKQRMDFLQSAVEDSLVIDKHHRRVSIIKSIFPVLILLGSSIIFSPALQEFPITASLYKVVSYSSDSIKEFLGKPFRKNIAEKYIQNYSFQGDQKAIKSALMESFKQYGADTIPGVAEFYAAQILYSKGNLQSSIFLMTLAWQLFDFDEAKISTVEDFSLATRRIVDVSMDNVDDYLGVEELLEEMHLTLQRTYSKINPKDNDTNILE